jgi:hypothetical protein
MAALDGPAGDQFGHAFVVGSDIFGRVEPGSGLVPSASEPFVDPFRSHHLDGGDFLPCTVSADASEAEEDR